MKVVLLDDPSPSATPAAAPDSSSDEDVVDVSNKHLEVSMLRRPGAAAGADAGATTEGLYVYRNRFYLLPRAVGAMKRLKTFKFFGNDIEVLPPEMGELGDLERLQVKFGEPGLSGAGLRKLKSLRELELCREPPRPSGLSILTEITGLNHLTKLSICHFSIRYLPPEIGCLLKLEELDLSFNKLEKLPNDIAKLSSLKSLRVGNNKLRDLPLGISSLRRLDNLDVSNNRLTSLTALDLDSMHALQYLNVQHNKSLCHFQVPPWICCNFEGTGVDITNDEIPRSHVEEKLYDVSASRVHGSRSCNGCPSISLCSHFENSLSCRQRMKKGWKRRDSLQQRARHERLNSSRMRRGEGHKDIITVNMAEENDSCESVVENENSEFQFEVDEEKILNSSVESHSQLEDTSGVREEDACDLREGASSHICTNVDIRHSGCSCSTSELVSVNNTSIFEHAENHLSACSLNELSLSDENSTIETSSSFKKSKKQYGSVDACDDYIDTASSSHNSTSIKITPGVCSCIASEQVNLNKCCKSEHDTKNHPLASSSNDHSLPEENSSPEASKVVNSKRQLEDSLDINPIRSKCPRPVNECSRLSCKYSIESFCSVDDHLPDGFYDAGRSRPFLSLQDYEDSLCLDSREVILLDREKDEELDAIAFSAQVLLSSLRRSQTSKNEEVMEDNLQRASVLALFVSDCFGGSDRSASVMRTRRAVVGSGKQQPFVCTCSGGSGYGNGERYKQIYGVEGSPNFTDLCEESLRLIKGTLNSNVVPLGILRFGVCRHRAVLMKYLCDRADPPIPCELVRGYLDFTPHAWNAIHVKRGNRWVRMVVDACYPTDIREEADMEYFCRYIPLGRLHVPVTTERHPTSGCFTPTPPNYETQKTPSCSVMHCKLGTFDAAMKVRTLEAYGASEDTLRGFEYTFLGEVRIMGALRKHNHITEIYGHQLSCKWVPPDNGNKESRVLQSIIYMEYIQGGSLKCYLKKLWEKGEKHVPVDIALCIARDVASALVEVHSKHIIHRDIKSENILMDLDSRRSDGSPIIKLSDFDRSVPLRASNHTCCIAHLGIHPPDACVGTPRWMAPEVVQTMHQRNAYGLEVDIWSYGCLLLELLTLQIPYMGYSDQQLYHLLQMKQRPKLTPELEALGQSREPRLQSELGSSPDAKTDITYLLVDLFYKCTEGNPANRPTARYIYDKLCAVSVST